MLLIIVDCEADGDNVMASLKQLVDDNLVKTAPIQKYIIETWLGPELGLSLARTYVEPECDQRIHTDTAAQC